MVSLIALACLAFAPKLSQAGQRSPHPAPPTHEGAAAPKEAHPASIPVAQRIVNNPALVARLQPLLPSGMTITNAAMGFKNQGQFIAALHVSHNLNIPFAQLKAEMTGTDRDSLGQAIHALMPNANAKAEAKRAETEAKQDLKATATHADTDRP